MSSHLTNKDARLSNSRVGCNRRVIHDCESPFFFVKGLPYRTIWLGYVALALILIVVMSRDFRPAPIHAKLIQPTELISEDFAKGEWLTMEFKAPGSRMNGIYWQNLLWSNRFEVEVLVENLTKGETLLRETLGNGAKSVQFRGLNEKGDLMRVSMRWICEIPPHLWVGTKPRLKEPALLKGNEIVPGFPLLLVSTEKEISNLTRPEDEVWREVVFEKDKPFTIQFTARKANLRSLVLPEIVQDHHAKLKIVITNVTTGKKLKSAIIQQGGRIENLVSR